MAGLMSGGGAAGPTTMGNTPMRSGGMASPAPGPAAMEREPGGAPGAGGEESANVSPEEQAAYDRFVNNGYSLIYDEKIMPKIVDMLGGDGDPKEGLANTAAMVVMQLEESAKKSGQEISPDVLLHGGTEILEDLAGLSAEAGIHDFQEDEMEGALYRALDIYREVRQGQGALDEGAIRQDFDMLVQADKQGSLEEMMPGLSAKFGDAPDPAGGAGPQAKGRPAEDPGGRR